MGSWRVLSPGEPADLAATIERGTAAAGGRGGFGMYAVVDVHFRSGHVLALRRCPFAAPASERTAVWHRAPDGTWTEYAEVPPTAECVDTAGRTADATIVAPIRLEWIGPRRLVVMVDGGRLVAWSISLAPTLMTRAFNVLAAMLGRPRAMWLVGASRAAIAGRDIGPIALLWLPRFACYSFPGPKRPGAPPPSFAAERGHGIDARGAARGNRARADRREDQ